MGSVSLSCSHCSAASIHCNIAVLQSEIRTPNSTKYRTIRNKMSYYRVRDCYDDMLHQRRQRSCSLPREDLGYGQDRHIRARSVGPVDHFSSSPAMAMTTIAATITTIAATITTITAMTCPCLTSTPITSTMTMPTVVVLMFLEGGSITTGLVIL